MQGAKRPPQRSEEAGAYEDPAVFANCLIRQSAFADKLQSSKLESFCGGDVQGAKRPPQQSEEAGAYAEPGT